VRSIGCDAELGGRGCEEEEEGGTRMKTTSGASVSIISYGCSIRISRIRLTNWVVIAEHERKSENLVGVDGIGIEDSYVHLPFSEVVCFDKFNARR
jgi:hypothetical protein